MTFLSLAEPCLPKQVDGSSCASARWNGKRPQEFKLGAWNWCRRHFHALAARRPYNARALRPYIRFHSYYCIHYISIWHTCKSRTYNLTYMRGSYIHLTHTLHTLHASYIRRNIHLTIRNFTYIICHIHSAYMRRSYIHGILPPHTYICSIHITFCSFQWKDAYPYNKVARRPQDWQN